MANNKKISQKEIGLKEYLETEKKRFQLKWESDLVESSRMSDFSILRTIATGAYGKVLLAQYNKDIMVTVMAIKVMEKKLIIKCKQEHQVMMEVKVMSCVRFPFIVPMEFYFKDNCYLYIGMPYISGNKLFLHLKDTKYFSEVDTIFYSGQVIMAIEYLHYMGIVYRDITPENILIDGSGYLKLSDFGFAKKIDDSRAWTLCGTPEYLAPEVILSLGYTKTVDWWSVGILIYEMAAGHAPFYDRDFIKLYEKIVSGKFEFPNSFSTPLRDLLSRLILVDRTKRLCSSKAGASAIKKHVFYKSVNWGDLFHKKIVPTYIPNVDGPADSSYFKPIKEIPLRTNNSEEFSDAFNETK